LCVKRKFEGKNSFLGVLRKQLIDSENLKGIFGIFLALIIITGFFKNKKSNKKKFQKIFRFLKIFF
jgi:uncharacterized membrane protein YfcA